MALSISYHTSGAWGAGLGRNLIAAEVDTNFYNIALAIVDLQTHPPAVNNISSITVDGLNMTIRLQDGTALGPFPLPVLEFRWRGAWTPFTIFAIMDVFMVEGVGIFNVLEPHTSGATFNAALLVSGDPAYNKLFGADAGSAASANIYDLGFFYPGRPQDSTNALLFDFPSLRKLILPITGSQHEATLTTAPGTTTQTYPIRHGGTHIGDITFAVGANAGVFSWLITADEIILAAEHLQIAKSAAGDGTAAGLAVNFALQRATT